MPLRLLAALTGALAVIPAANAGCPVQVSASSGSAPLQVRFHAGCGSSAYRWDFGDGRVAYGRTVTHTFTAGRFGPVLSTDEAAVPLPPVTSVSLELVAPAKATYGDRVTLHADVVPPLPVHIGPRVFKDGELTLTITRPFLTAAAGPAVVHRTIVVQPRLDVRLEGSTTIASALHVVATLRPAHAGTLQVSVDGAATSQVDTDDVHTARIVVSSIPKPSWAPVSQVLRARIQAPTLSIGSSGAAVVALERRLRDLHYAVHDTSGDFDANVQQAVYAFQAVGRLIPTGVVTPGLWKLLAHASVPRARYGGDHVEVDKTRQVLFVVRGGQVELVSHVSTGATGNTPLGLWHVYRKVPGFDWVLFYPSYFLRGFAIHGYPDVPPYPASHGCVRIPMWLAPKLYPQVGMGSSIYIYTS